MCRSKSWRLASHILPKPAEQTIPKVYYTTAHQQAEDAIFAKQGLLGSEIVMIVSPYPKYPNGSGIHRILPAYAILS
jgi:hypothetical protein